jgi:SNF2 family DNA or RNA helicase
MTKPIHYPLTQYYRAAQIEGTYDTWANNIFLPFKPYDHQITGLQKSLAYDRFGLYDEPACGKSLVAQAWAMHWASYKNKVVFIMPPSLTEQFSRSFRTNYQGFDEMFNTHILKQSPKQRQKLFATWTKYDSWPDVMLMSYEMFRITWRELRNGGGYRVLGCDESHKLKNPESVQHQAMTAFLGPTLDETALLSMTGTPIPNTLEDCYGMVKMLTPEIYRNKSQFERQHVIFQRMKLQARPGQGKGQSFLQVAGFRDRDTLSTNMYLQARRVLKDDVFDLRKPKIVEVEVSLSPAHKKLYTKLVKERILILAEELIDATSASSLRQKCLRLVANPDRFSDTEKQLDNWVTQAVDDKLEQIGEKEKVVLVGHFRETIEMLAKKYDYLNPALMYGGTKGSQQKQIDKFISDDTCRMVIIHPDSGGVGVDGFQHVCRYMIFVEPTSVPGKFVQTTERLVRPGQQHVVTVWILKVLGTVSPKLTTDMFRKSYEAQQVTRDKTTMLSDLLGDLPN